MRIGNENLLDNLKEGVVILCQDNQKVRFSNTAAKAYDIQSGKLFKARFLDTSQTVGLQDPEFALLDKKALHRSVDSKVVLKTIAAANENRSLEQLIQQQLESN